MRSFKHWTPRYIVDRIALMVYEHRNPSAPWLTSASARILDNWLRPTDRGLEWGSGGSTVWIAKRVAHLISVEHNEKWADIISRSLRAENLTERVHYIIYKKKPEYVSAVDAIEKESLDVCLVDGIERDRCALACLSKIKPGGILVVDNANWYLPRDPKSRAPNSKGVGDGFASEKWAMFHDAVKDWRHIWTSNGITDTALWVKPPTRSRCA